MQTISAASAAALDATLLGTGGWALPALVELAGLSVATALISHSPTARTVHVLIGPGNNGADGLVAARHLATAGLRPVVVLPPRASQHKRTIQDGLLFQLAALGVPVVGSVTSLPPRPDVIIDAVLGFGARGPPRPPYDALIAYAASASEWVVADGGGTVMRPGGGAVLLCVDTPSGWEVDAPTASGSLRPSVLVSLSLPKPCASGLDPRAAHYLGGRFIPPGVAAELGAADWLERAWAAAGPLEQAVRLR